VKKLKSFSARCYALLRRVPPGRVTTYRELAKALGSQAYRAVGNALRRNPYAPKVPCHRVVKSDGRLGGFAHGQGRKASLLRQEGIMIKNSRIMDFARRLYRFKFKAP